MMTQTTINRRRALAVVATAPAAVALSTTVLASAGEDAELLRLWEEWLDQGTRTLAAQDTADTAEKAASAEIRAVPGRVYGIGWSKWRGRLWPTVFEHRLENADTYSRTVELRTIRLDKGDKPLKPRPGPIQNCKGYDAAEALRRRYQAAHQKATRKARAAIMEKHNFDALDMAARREWEKLAAIDEKIRSAPTESAAGHAIKAAVGPIMAFRHATDWVGVIMGGSTLRLREALEVHA